jgi:Protein of unknown function (DUF2442)
MNPRVKNVEAVADYLLELEFDNGEKGVFDMTPYLRYPVFQPLKDVSLFNKAHVTMGFVSWNDEIDMSPDTLYLDCKITA